MRRAPRGRPGAPVSAASSEFLRGRSTGGSTCGLRSETTCGLLMSTSPFVASQLFVARCAHHPGPSKDFAALRLGRPTHSRGTPLLVRFAGGALLHHCSPSQLQLRPIPREGVGGGANGLRPPLPQAQTIPKPGPPASRAGSALCARTCSSRISRWPICSSPPRPVAAASPRACWRTRFAGELLF